MDRIDPVHFMFMVWGATQHYADFATQVHRALGKDVLDDSDFNTAEQTLCHIVLKGVGLQPAG
jgi:TetR/AcrR family transcriptional regulator